MAFCSVDALHSRLNRSKGALEARQVLLQRQQQPFDMSWRRDHPAAHLGTGGLGLHEDEIEDEFGIVMVNYRQVDVNSLGGLLVKLDFQLDFLGFRITLRYPFL